MEKYEINSKEYWENRFKTNDWSKNGGNTQTEYFYDLLYNLLPNDIKEEFRANNYSLCDLGCAEGDGVNYLHKKFSNLNLTGIDISKSAIDKAKEKFSNLDFKTELKERYDIVLSSNVLEHFENPFEMLEKLFMYSNKYVIILIPFEEYQKIEEHFYTFTYKDFSLKYKDFSLVYVDYIFSKKIWQGKQHLFIYQKSEKLEKIDLEKIGVSKIIHEKEEKIDNFSKNIKQLEKGNLILSNELDKNKLTLKKEQKKYIKEIEDFKKQINVLNQDNLRLNSELEQIYSSRMWKFANKYYYLRDNTCLKYPYKALKSVKKYGLKETFNKVNKKAILSYKKLSENHEKDLEKILEKHKNKTIIILPVLVDWNIPLFQRPQHLAKNLAKNGVLYFYCTNNGGFDNINGFEEVIDSCYLTNRFDLVDKIKGRKKYYDLSSTDNSIELDFVFDKLNNNNGIIYQYIDEISQEISGVEIPKKVFEKHEKILKDKRCFVVPSATKLEDEVKEYREENFKLVTNGVEIEHFSKNITKEQIPEEIKSLLSKKKPIIGYFGAFASWFDYELIIKLSKSRGDLEILLLGVDYDGSIKKYALEDYDNITVLGPINYKDLPSYASCFNVSIIPFILNDITESTSPIKLFEYMAMGKAIVTTNMPECRKYKSVLIGKNHDEFLSQIDKAIELNSDEEYKNILKKEAEENSWETKAKDILSLIK